MVDNFLQAALHLFYLKMTEFPDGSLPDYPDLLKDHLRCVRQMSHWLSVLMFPSIFKDEISTDQYIEDQEEGNHYVREMNQAHLNTSSAQNIHQQSTPLLLALLLSPFYLLFPFRLTKRTFNRRLVLESFAQWTSHKTPLVLEIERSIWRSLIALADATITPHDASNQLVSRLPWTAIEAASNNSQDPRMFCLPSGADFPSAFQISFIYFLSHL